jgi:hypothetical protein
MVDDPETPACPRSARDLPDGRWQHADSEGGRPELTSARTPQRADSRRCTESGVAHCRKRQAVPHGVDYTTSEGDGQVSNESDEDPSELSSSDHGGHDNCQPKRRSSAKYFSACEWTTKEWKILRTSSSISDSDDASDDDGKPRFHTKPSKRKTK